MNAYKDHAANAVGSRSDVLGSARGALRRAAGLLFRRFMRIRGHGKAPRLDHLEDWVLKDVGLIRERLPNGATRIRRR